VAIVAMLGAVLVGAPAGANHNGTTCSTTGDANHIKKTLKAPEGFTVDAVDYKKFDFYILKGFNDVIVDSAADVDITMCIIGQASHVCDSHELPLVPDECSGLNPATTYRLDIKHCISAECGEVDGVTVPIPYVVIATNV
jgi:hypothetical protein